MQIRIAASAVVDLPRRVWIGMAITIGNGGSLSSLASVARISAERNLYVLPPCRNRCRTRLRTRSKGCAPIVPLLPAVVSPRTQSQNPNVSLRDLPAQEDSAIEQHTESRPGLDIHATSRYGTRTRHSGNQPEITQCRLGNWATRMSRF